MVLKHNEALEAATLAAVNAAAAATASPPPPPSATPLSSAAENEEKFEKLKSAYQKLRNEHVALLRLNAEAEKRAKSTATNEMFQTVQQCLGSRATGPITRFACSPFQFSSDKVYSFIYPK